MLISECERVSVKFLFNTTITEVSRNTGFSVSTNQGTFCSESLVIATGGLSYPNIGASNFGYEIARQFGIKVTKLSPALTPLRFSPLDAEVFGVLAGISIDCKVSQGGVSFQDGVLFTHTGLSGPAILQISSYWDGKNPLLNRSASSSRHLRHTDGEARLAITAAHCIGPLSARAFRTALVRPSHVFQAVEPVLDPGIG